MKQITNNYTATQELGADFAKNLHGGDVLLLFGELGSGKTTFMQGLAKGLGIERRIISPTFIIVRKYDVSKMEKAHNIQTLYHIDLYRTQTEDDLKGLGMDDLLHENNALVAIEWPEKLGSFLPAKRWELHFQALSENERSITIEKYE
jgi:tRNA threonylcarbamoyladenosine biosynthesis protein TsaE